MPRMAFIGVRISCDMSERNSDLACEAASAASRAAISSRSFALSCEISRTTETTHFSPLIWATADDIRIEIGTPLFGCAMSNWRLRTMPSRSSRTRNSARRSGSGKRSRPNVVVPSTIARVKP